MSNELLKRSTCLMPILVAALVWPATAHADRYRTTQHNFGGVGLLQTPTARMAPVGAFRFNANRTAPYSRYSISAQPLPWMEGTLRYIAISNRNYSENENFSTQSLKDKAFDFKFRLLKESYWLPDLSVGFRDLAGTGLFSSEFVVANKRFYDLDFSLGVAWGYIGNRGDFSNPLAIIGDGYNERNAATVGTGGDFSLDNYFRGRPSIFGGVEYQSPWDPLRFKIELDGNDYQSEPQNNNQEQDSPINFGVVYRLTDTVDFTAAWERGNTAMFGITLHTNLKTSPFPSKLLDPPPVERREPLPAGVSGEAVDWAKVSDQLRDNAGFAVENIEQRKRELIITGEQTTYREQAKGLGRASRILDNATGTTYDWYTLVNKPRGMAVSEASIDASVLRDLEQNRVDEETVRRSTVLAAPSELHTETLHTEPLDKFTYGLSLGYNQNVGGPDDFILYQFLARLSSEYRFNRNQWVRGSLGINLINNFDEFNVRGVSNLPQVRTDIREYLITSDVVLENLQYTHTKRIARDVYAIGYVGLLESMFGGVGGEVLYRPHGSNWALGANANWVRQRGFRQDFSFRDYSVFTGHVTAYMRTNFYDVVAKVSAGQYLAGDKGGTLELARQFDNGMTMGAWVTRTNVSAEQFGEGSFDKGIYFTIPFDAFFAKSSMAAGTLSWSPLTRDGGARLARYYQLYDLTSASDISRFDAGFSGLSD